MSTDIVSFAVVEAATGRITSTGVCGDDEVSSATDDAVNFPVYITPVPYRYSHQYYDGSAFQDRGDLTATWDTQSIDADDLDAATLSGLPTVCTVSVDGVDHAVTDGTFVLTADSPGFYKIRVDHPEFLVKEWTIDAD